MPHLLSGNALFETTAGLSGLVYPHMFAQIIEHLIKACDRHQTNNLFDWLNQKVFSSMTPKTAQPSVEQQAEEEEDYDKLDEPDSDKEFTLHNMSDPLPASMCSSSRLETSSESMSFWSQIVPATLLSN